MKVSVLLPVFNAGPALRQAIDSILAQDEPEFELVVLDDSSTDGSGHVIREYAARDERIRAVYHDRNIGLSATLNEGLELTRGELVARMDQDDEALPHRLRVQTAFMDERPEVVAAGSFVYHMGARRRYDHLVRFPTEPETIRAALPRENCLYHPSVIMRRREILRLGGYRPEFRNAEDYDLWLRASKRHDLANVPEPLLRYRFSVNGMTLSRKWEQLFFVHFAQAAANDSLDSLDAARAEAERTLAETDRREFLTIVGNGTLSELVALHMWRDALTVARRLAADVGVATAAGVLAGVVRTHGRLALAARARRLAT